MTLSITVLCNFRLHARRMCQWHKMCLQAPPKTVWIAFHGALSSSVITAFIVSSGHFDKIDRKKNCSSRSSIRFDIKWPTGYPLPNSSGTTRFNNWNPYWFVQWVASTHKTVLAPTFRTSICSFVCVPKTKSSSKRSSCCMSESPTTMSPPCGL